MRGLSLFGVLALVALLLVSCSTSTLKQDKADDGSLSLAPLITIVCDRHDAAVKADDSLDLDHKAGALVESTVLRDAFKAEKVPIPPIFDKGISVLNRHDAYVVADTKKTPEQRLRALRSSQLIRETFQKAMGIQVAPDTRPTPTTARTGPQPVEAEALLVASGAGGSVGGW